MLASPLPPGYIRSNKFEVKQPAVASSNKAPTAASASTCGCAASPALSLALQLYGPCLVMLLLLMLFMSYYCGWKICWQVKRDGTCLNWQHVLASTVALPHASSQTPVLLVAADSCLVGFIVGRLCYFLSYCMGAGSPRWGVLGGQGPPV